MPLVRIEMKKGKSSEYKKTLFDCVHSGLVDVIELITAKLGEKLSIASTDIFIEISEPPLENWGMGGHQKG